MKISTKCDKCNSRFSVDEKYVGRKAKCAKCGADFIVKASNENPPPQKPAGADRPAAQSPMAAAEEPDIFSLAAKETTNCTNCGKPMPPEAVLCVSCGYDMRTGMQMPVATNVVLPKRGAAASSKRKSDDAPSTKKRSASGGKMNAKNIAKVVAVLLILAASVGIVFGVMALYRRMEFSLKENEAFVRLDVILTDRKPKAKQLAEELPYVYDYFEHIKIKQPKYVPDRLKHFNDAIPRIPKEADLTPLLKFPVDSRQYGPILELIERNTELSWQIEKSCDSSETARHYCADAIMFALPFITWTEADKNALRERTSVAEKESRFRKYAEQCQLAAEKQLPGRFSLRLKAEYVYFRTSVEATTETLGPAFEAASKNRVWNVTFFGNTWSGPIEKITHLDLSCPIWEKRDLYGYFPFFIHLKVATVHLRFRDGAFIVEPEDYPAIGDAERKQGFADLQGILAKAPADEAMMPAAVVPAEVRDKVDKFAEKLQKTLLPQMQNLVDQSPGAKEALAQVSISEIDARANTIDMLSAVMDKETESKFTKPRDKELLDPANSPYVGSLSFTETITANPACSLSAAWKCYYVYHRGKWTFLGVHRIPSKTGAESLVRQLKLIQAIAEKQKDAQTYAKSIDFHARYAQAFESIFASHPVAQMIINIE
jgi:hypothetical protein